MIDPRHGRFVPVGRRLAAAVRRVFTRQAGEAFAALRRGSMPNLWLWDRPLAEAAEPHLIDFLRAGAKLAWHAIAGRRPDQNTAALSVQGTPVSFVPHGRARRGDRLMLVPAGRIDAAWSRDAGYYLPPGAEGVTGRRRGVLDFLRLGRPVESPLVDLDEGGVLSVEDGRHRLAVLRDLGVSQIPVTVRKAQVRAFRRKLGATFPWEQRRRTPLSAPSAAGGGRRLPPGRLTTASPLPPPRPRLGLAFDYIHPEVLQQARTAALQFAHSTNRTSLYQLNEARERLRIELATGLEEGDPVTALAKRVGRVFATDRARMIAQTESSRAMHAGKAIVARLGGTWGRRWLASSDACPLCLELDGRALPWGVPFAVDPRGGPYAVVMDAPRHPNCRCTFETVEVDPALYGGAA